MYRLNSVSIVAQCPPVPQQNLHNTSSPLRLHQPTQPAPAHMLTVQGRIWISAVREHCAGRTALSDLQQEEIKDEEQSDRWGLAWRKMAYVARAKAQLIVGLKLHVSIHSHTASILGTSDYSQLDHFIWQKWKTAREQYCCDAKYRYS